LIKLVVYLPLILFLISKRRKLKLFLKNGYETFLFYIIIILGIIINLTNVNVSLAEITTIGLSVVISIDYIRKPYVAKKLANKISIVVDRIDEELIKLIEYFKEQLYSVTTYTTKESNINVDIIVSKKKNLLKLLNKIEEGFVIAYDDISLKLLEKLKNDRIIKIYRGE